MRMARQSASFDGAGSIYVLLRRVAQSEISQSGVRYCRDSIQSYRAPSAKRQSLAHKLDYLTHVHISVEYGESRN